ncbi:hypothetical protein GCM10020358_46400 [Amorphoplanes nipponensis]|uniref:Uncharacterized protein n=1 Tax=Actinoplanes nipponensis TaxID=135950 RepID=A0A919JQD1_9ACTN|nr:hypothetical protein Ani05nite_70210 [Actinoplanes nipponensis]
MSIAHLRKRTVGVLLSGQNRPPHAGAVDRLLSLLAARGSPAAVVLAPYARAMEVVIVIAVLALIAVALGVARDRGLSRRIGREVRKDDGDDS